MAQVEHFLRIANTDLVGKKPIVRALTKIKGISYNYAHALCKVTKTDPSKLAGTFKPEEVKVLETAIENSPLPEWMRNRLKDRETGEAKHITGPTLKITIDNDLKIDKRLKSYRGLRHQAGLTVRGQRTESNFRKKKGKGLGVKRKKK